MAYVQTDKQLLAASQVKLQDLGFEAATVSALTAGKAVKVILNDTDQKGRLYAALEKCVLAFKRDYF